ncbi:MAG: lysozyme inhibitor LprI family protein [Bdellovibrionales bacterium]
MSNTLFAKLSFECKKNQLPSQQLICQDAELAQLDNNMSEVYKGILDQNTKTGNERKIREDQRNWISGRDACIIASDLLEEKARARGIDCLKNSYQTRIDILAAAETSGTFHTMSSECTLSTSPLPEWNGFKKIEDISFPFPKDWDITSDGAGPISFVFSVSPRLNHEWVFEVLYDVRISEEDCLRLTEWGDHAKSSRVKIGGNTFIYDGFTQKDAGTPSFARQQYRSYFNNACHQFALIATDEDRTGCGLSEANLKPAREHFRDLISKVVFTKRETGPKKIAGKIHAILKTNLGSGISAQTPEDVEYEQGTFANAAGLTLLRTETVGFYKKPLKTAIVVNESNEPAEKLAKALQSKNKMKMQKLKLGGQPAFQVGELPGKITLFLPSPINKVTFVAEIENLASAEFEIFKNTLEYWEPTGGE